MCVGVLQIDCLTLIVNCASERVPTVTTKTTMADKLYIRAMVGLGQAGLGD